MTVTRREMFTRTLPTAAAKLAVPTLLKSVAFSQDAHTAYAAVPKPTPLPANLIADMNLVLPILLPKMRTKTATAEQILHLAELFDWFSRELTACHWNPTITAAYSRATLAQVKAGMPAYAERIYSEFRQYDKGLTLADTRYVSEALLNTIVNGPATNSVGSYHVSFQAIQKALADHTMSNTASALKTLSRSPFLEGNSPSGNRVSPDYLFSACTVLDFGGGVFGGLAFLSAASGIGLPAAPWLGGISFGMFLGYAIFCT